MTNITNTRVATSDSLIIGLPQHCKNGCGTIIRVVYLPRRDRYMVVEDPTDVRTSRLVRHNCEASQ